MPCVGCDVEKQVFLPIDRNVNWQIFFVGQFGEIYLNSEHADHLTQQFHF